MKLSLSKVLNENQMFQGKSVSKGSYVGVIRSKRKQFYFVTDGVVKNDYFLGYIKRNNQWNSIWLNIDETKIEFRNIPRKLCFISWYGVNHDTDWSIAKSYLDKNDVLKEYDEYKQEGLSVLERKGVLL